MNKKEIKNLIYVGGNIGINDTAMGIHAKNLASLFTLLGYNISFICQNTPSEEKKFINEEKYNYYYTKRYIKFPKIKIIEDIIEEFIGIKLFLLFKKIIKEKKPEIVVFYGTSCEKKIINYCKRKKIPIYIDETDWFELDDREGFFLTKYYRNYRENYNIEKLNFRANGVIAISKYFFKYYEEKGQHCIWIPPIFKIESFKEKQIKKPIKLIYAGSLAGNKDIIDPVIRLLLFKINLNRIYFHLDLIGISELDLNRKFGEFNWKSKGIYAWGRLTHNETLNKIKQADFSILLRQNKRYAKAGFSTKFAESLTQSVPIICTEIGGSDCLIKNFNNGILVKDNTEKTIEEVLNQILNLPFLEIEDMRRKAYKTALEKLDYRVYKNSLKQFIEETKNKYV